VKFGIMIVPEDRWQTAREKWRRAEQMGFDHAWTYDHINWRAFRDKEWFTAVPTLAAAAVETTRIGLGVLVASPNLRHPVYLAKEVTTLDDMSSGRLILGIGSGATGFDATVTRRAAWSVRERADRFDEYVALTDRLLTQQDTTFDGRHYVANEVRIAPQARVPFAVAAAGTRGMRLAARYGQYWVTMGVAHSFESAPYDRAVPVIRRQVEALERACAEAGRDPATIGRLLVTGPSVGNVLDSSGAFFDAADKFAEAGITDLVVQWPRHDEPFRGSEDVLDKIAEELSR